MNRPKISDVAKVAEVSNSTVSYVINNGPRNVSDETRLRVLSVIEELGYHPHAAARNLRKGNTQTIGFLVQSLKSAYVSNLVDSVEKYLTKKNYYLILASAHEDHERESYMINALANQSIDGLLFIPTSCENGYLINRLIQSEMPIVLVDRNIKGVAADLVMTDNFEAAKVATNYLIRNGCQRIMCISFSKEASSAIDRVEGFKQALTENKIPLEEKYISNFQYDSDESIEKLLLENIQQSGLPDGIMCTTDTIFIDVIKSLKKNGIRIPDQVIVTGSFYNSPWNDLLEPPLPVVSQNYDLMAKHAVEFLIDRINGNKELPRIKMVDASFFNM
jgi:DNA-binding LacI/PurR family transcriptional regulator